MKLFSFVEPIIEPWKAYLDPRAHLCYHRIRNSRSPNSGTLEHDPTRAVDVLLDISGHQLDRDLGRLSYYLATLFHFSGFRVFIRDRFRFLASFRRKHFKQKLLDYPWKVVAGTESLRSGFWWVTDRQVAGRPPGCAQILHLDYTVRLPQPGDIPLPYCISPSVIDTLQGFDPTLYSRVHRPIRLFFAGSLHYRYNRGHMEKRHGIVSRTRVIQCLRERFSRSLIEIRSRKELEERLPDLHDRMVVLAPDAPLLSTDEWLWCLGHSRAFLAAPGVHMPLSHNLWEALAMGTLPVLEYPHYLTPPLTHGHNAWVYHGLDDLEAKTRELLTAPDSSLIHPGEAARAYYDRHASPDAFLRRIRNSEQDRHRILVYSWECPRPTYTPPNGSLSVPERSMTSNPMDSQDERRPIPKDDPAFPG